MTDQEAIDYLLDSYLENGSDSHTVFITEKRILKRKLGELIANARIDENMQTRIIAKLAYVQGGEMIYTSNLIKLLDDRLAELKSKENK